MANSIVFKANAGLLNRAIINHIQKRAMPVNVPPTATGKRRFRLEVETDPHKLVNYCCGLNYHIDEPLIKLKPEQEYPEWLWDLRLTPRPKSYEMEKGTKEYYLRLREEGESLNRILKLKGGKAKKVVDKVMLARQDYKHYKRFAALAWLEDDIGLEKNHLEHEYLNHNEIKKSDYYLPMIEGKVLYADKIKGNIALKNFKSESDNSFVSGYKPLNKPPSVFRQAKLDSKQRHRYSVF